MDRSVLAGRVAGDQKDMDDILAHYGIKGMKWGVRRSPAQLRKARPAASDDHKVSRTAKKKAKAGGLKSLSNDELKTYLERMDLERRYKKSDTSPKAEAQKFIKDTLQQVGKQEAGKFLAKQVAKSLAGRG